MSEIRGATWEDFDDVHTLLDVRSRAVSGVSEVEREHLRRQWELPAFVVGRDNWVATVDDEIVGYAELSPTQELTHAARDAAIGDSLLAAAEEAARERRLEFLAATSVLEDAPLQALLVRNGYELDGVILRMWRTLDGDLPEARWSDGVGVRTYEDDDGPRVQALLDEAYGGWDADYVQRGHDDWLAFMTEHDDFEPALWFLVERDRELVACALHWKEHQGRGWVKDIVVRENERGHGLGMALLQHALRAYARRGAERVGLKVDSNNPTGAPRLYERAGFETDRRYGIWTKRL